MSEMKKWYQVDNIEEVDSPALLVYPDRIRKNIELFKSFARDPALLRPHVKTNKSSAVSKLLLQAGITKFKCATIAEAEMLAMCDAPDVLLAHQPVGPKAQRLAGLAKVFKATRFSTIIDDHKIAKRLSDVFVAEGLSIPAYIDLNVGMNRSGIKTENAMALYKECMDLKGISIVGLHMYDGHLRDPDIAIRTTQCNAAFRPVEQLQQDLEKASGKKITIVAGGTPTFPIHAKRGNVECSPGTFVYWDLGYSSLLREQAFEHAAVVVTRVISKVDDETVCVDLGHKAIASENPLTSRVAFLDIDVVAIGHSEEHLVLKVNKQSNLSVGDVLYGIPYHICPTVALHEFVHTIEGNRMTGTWNNISR
jgi:D-serine deaminase-like pyridoxal phosphate-dependent protein